LDVCCKYEAIFTVKQPIVFLHCWRYAREGQIAAFA
jgi:hypothetical protein